MGVKAQKPQKLFANFHAVSKSEWIAKAIKDLKGEDSFNKLIWKTEEGMEVFPFYTREDLKGKEALEKFHNLLISKKATEQGVRTWDYLELINISNETQANKQALDALNKGADGIAFSSSEMKDAQPENVLQNIFPHHCSVVLETDNFSNSFFTKFPDYLKNYSQHADQIKGALIYDPIHELARSGAFYYDLTGHVELFEKTKNFPALKTVSIKADLFHNSGADIAQELGCTLSSLVFYLDKFTESRIEASEVLKKLYVSVSIGTDFFREIAKLKAMRMLIYKIAESYDHPQFNPSTVTIHCNSSEWNKTSLDSHSNILRHTTEAISAIVGGCNFLTLAPFDSKKTSDAFSKRISRNISNILKEEAYLGKVADPAAGSYYIECLVSDLVKAGWEQFLSIEEQGGIKIVLEKGLIQNEIEKSRNKKLSLIAERKISIIGTNKYPNIHEKVILDVPEREKMDKNPKILKEKKASEQFEDLRARYQNLLKRMPYHKVLLMQTGDPLMKKLRADFSRDFFACAGLTTESAVLKNIHEACESAAKSTSQIIVLCGADQDYAESAAIFARNLKNSSPSKLLILAGSPKGIVEELKSSGIDEFIYSGCNVPAILGRILSRLENSTN